MLNEGVGGGLEWFWEGEELGLSAERMLGSRARGLRVEGPGRGMRAGKECSAGCSSVFLKTNCWLNFPRGSGAWAEGCVSPLGRTWTSPAQPVMNLTLMTLQWGTMSSGKHSGNPSCSGDQSPTAARQGGWETPRNPARTWVAAQGPT